MLQKLVALLAIVFVCFLNLVRPVDLVGVNSIRGGQEPLYPRVLEPINPKEPVYCNAIELFDKQLKCSGTPIACSNTPRQAARFGEPGSNRINMIHIQNNLGYCGDINCVGNHYELSDKNPCTHAATPAPKPNWPVVGSQ